MMYHISYTSIIYMYMIPGPSLLASTGVGSRAVPVMLTCIRAFWYRAVVTLPPWSAFTCVGADAGAFEELRIEN